MSPEKSPSRSDKMSPEELLRQQRLQEEYDDAIEKAMSSGMGERTRSLAFNFRADNCAAKLEIKEAGCPILLDEGLSKALMADLLLSPALERGERPDYWAVSGVASLTEKARLTVDDALSHPEGVAGFAREVQENVTTLARLKSEEAYLNTEISDMRRDKGVNASDLLNKEAELEKIKAELREQFKKVVDRDQDLIILAEDENSLQTEGTEERLEAKLDQLKLLSTAAIGAKNLVELENEFVRRSSDIGNLRDIMLEGGFQLSMEEMSVLTGLPGLEEPIRFCFGVLADLDMGKGLLADSAEESPLPDYRYNLCAMENVTPRVKSEFKKDLVRLIRARTNASPYAAEMAYEIVQAIREVTFLNGYYDHPRDETGQMVVAIDNTKTMADKEKRQLEKEARKEERKRKTVGSARALIPPDFIKIFDLNQRIRNEFEKGRPVPIGVAKRDLPDLNALSCFHYMKMAGGDKTAHQRLYQDKASPSEVFSGVSEDSSLGSRVAHFYAMGLYASVLELPVEDLAVASGEAKRIEGAAMKTAESITRIHKAIQNSRGSTVTALKGEEEGRIEVARITFNLIGAVLRYNVLRDPNRGGRIANDEGTLDAGTRWATMILTSLIADNNRVLTPRQAAFLEAMIFRLDSVDIPSDLLTISEVDAAYGPMRELLAEEPDEDAFTSGGVIMDSLHYQLHSIDPEKAKLTREAAIRVAMTGTKRIMEGYNAKIERRETLEEEYQKASQGIPSVPGRSLLKEIGSFMRK